MLLTIFSAWPINSIGGWRALVALSASRTHSFISVGSNVGPLSGIRIVEFAGIGPAPFAAMLLCDMGADVIRIERKGGNAVADMARAINRGRRVVVLDLKLPQGVEAALELIESADALIEGFRPGVMERLGLGPEVCLRRNPKLAYARMTGWGQTGPLAQAAGHDINYIAITGALHAIGRQGGKPALPLNLIGDFGGGSMYLAFGIVCALLEAKASGKGQVIDAAITDGVAYMMSLFYALVAEGSWHEQRGENMLDGGSHFYDVYATKDGKFVSVGALEPQFYRELLARTGLDGDPAFAVQLDRDAWPELKERLAAVFKTKTRDEWDAILLESDACYAPVMSISEAARHPHNVARAAFVEVDGVMHAAPAPRFSRTVPKVQTCPAGSDSKSVLAAWGFSHSRIEALDAAGVFRTARVTDAARRAGLKEEKRS
jgi:alpha-methylacyl-CoA racemase